GRARRSNGDQRWPIMGSTKETSDCGPNVHCPLLAVRSFGGLLSCRATALGSPRRSSFFPADRDDTDFGGPFDFRRNCGNRSRLLVRESLPLIVPEDHFVVGNLLEVLGEKRNLATATR